MRVNRWFLGFGVMVLCPVMGFSIPPIGSKSEDESSTTAKEKNSEKSDKPDTDKANKSDEKSDKKGKDGENQSEDGTKSSSVGKETKISKDGSKPKDTKGQKKVSNPLQYNRLSAEEERVILRKGTERAFTGKFTDSKRDGTYLCKRCNAPLYDSKDKFPSHCGWPSFDDEIKGAVKHQLETDGTGRIEIVCACCGGHLGHVFEGEQFTQKNVRHCVNSVSMKFVPRGQDLPKVIRPQDDGETPAETPVSKPEEPKKSNDSDKPTVKK
jgi:methionine-R-sulfoxide reductase